ncbi:MAG: protocatechuate 3,4-dioxygenase subunit alpha [Aestuariivita sp.]|nr:protocatechuate 3,4-dioxygenase subunit alpha [Aestuariivita sp.]MCY4347167.1 protocatechuate 3,4-dioxygenase subunit alpha [Aestuariivita sp.]
MERDTLEPSENQLFETASQTAGPYLHIGLAPNSIGLPSAGKEPRNKSCPQNQKTDSIQIVGTVWDGRKEPVKDAMLEAWQPDLGEISADSGIIDGEFERWHRVVTDFRNGNWSFNTCYPRTFGNFAPSISFWLVARGINIGLHTRMYFPENTKANALDPVLNSVAVERRNTLIAHQVGRLGYRFDIVLQGDNETVFFDV